MPVKAVNYETGIEIWEGLPGSGKSYGVVERLIRIILVARRPVYTNLPLRMPVVRRYLANRGGAKLARYIQPLTREHFRAFLLRNQLLARLIEQREQEAKLLGKRVNLNEVEAEFDSQVVTVRTPEGREKQVVRGPGIIRGPQANWLPPGAVLVIDELHRWYDQRVQKEEGSELLDYVTMHRHHLHWLLLITQNKMQVSISFRRNCHRVIHCADKRRLPFLFGLKLPVPAFSYEEWPAEWADSANPGLMKPTDVWVRVPWLTGGLVWRFYSSFTHMGSVRRLERRLAEVRQQIEGEPGPEPVAAREAGTVKRNWRKNVLWAGLAGVLVAVGVLAGRWLTGESQGQGQAAAGPSAAVVHPPVVATQPAAVSEPVVEPFAGTVSAVASDWVVVDGRVVKVGGLYASWKLESVDVRSGLSLWLNGPAVHSAGLGGVGVRSTVPGGPRASGGPGRAAIGSGGRANHAAVQPGPGLAHGPGHAGSQGSAGGLPPVVADHAAD